MPTREWQRYLNRVVSVSRDEAVYVHPADPKLSRVVASIATEDAGELGMFEIDLSGGASETIDLGVAEALNRAGVEARAGCHCATLAHHALRLTPPASCRLSFYLYNTLDDVDHAVDAVAAVASRRQPRAA